MRSRIFLLALVLTAGCGSSRKASALVTGFEPYAPNVVFRDISVFAGDTTQSVSHADVWIHDGRIGYVGRTGSAELPADAAVIDGKGLTLLPGLIDLHTHTEGDSSPPWDLGLPNAERNLTSNLFSGITTIADLGGGLEAVTTRRNDIESGKVLGPHMLVTGPHFTATGGHPIAMLRYFVPWPVRAFIEPNFGYQIDSTLDVELAMKHWLSFNPDFVKVTSDEIPQGIPTIRPDVVKAIVAAAHAANRKAFAHIGSNADIEKMIDAGVDVFVHGVYRETLRDEVAAQIAARNIPVAPTLAVFDTADRLSAGDLSLSASQLAVGDPATVIALQNKPSDYAPPEVFLVWLKNLRANRTIKMQNVATLRRHGVRILAGSDSPGMGHFGGAGLHDELDLLVQAGLTPGEALKAATFDNSDVLGIAADRGVIATGKRADILVVRGDPVTDIKNVHAIHSVYQSGRKVIRVAQESR